MQKKFLLSTLSLCTVLLISSSGCFSKPPAPEVTIEDFESLSNLAKPVQDVFTIEKEVAVNGKRFIWKGQFTNKGNPMFLEHDFQPSQVESIKLSSYKGFETKFDIILTNKYPRTLILRLFQIDGLAPNFLEGKYANLLNNLLKNFKNEQEASIKANSLTWYISKYDPIPKGEEDIELASLDRSSLIPAYLNHTATTINTESPSPVMVKANQIINGYRTLYQLTLSTELKSIDDLDRAE